MVRILISRSAERELARLPREIQRRFAMALEELAKDSRPRPCLDVKPLRGMKGGGPPRAALSTLVAGDRVPHEDLPYALRDGPTQEDGAIDALLLGDLSIR